MIHFFLSIYIQNFSGYCRLKGLDVNGRKKCWLFPIIFSRFTSRIIDATGTPEQARPARPRSDLDFQIHNVEAT